ncbi:glycosyltransferase family 4 protein [Azospirillum sp. sgz301742]
MQPSATPWIAKPWIVVAGRLPPPIDGMARVTTLVLERLRQHGPVHVANLSPGHNGRGPLYHAVKASLVLWAALLLWAGAMRDDKRLYMPADAGLGCWYTIFLLGVARLLGYSTFVHHHSFAYLTRRTARMRLLTRIAGPECRHILLCPAMLTRFQRLYPCARRGVVLPNAIFSTPAAEPAPLRRSHGALRLGHLSNLCADKGLDTLFSLLRALLDEGVAAKLVLAGPGLGRMDEAMIAAGLYEFGDAVEYLGPIDGADKEAFYRAIDVFAFPTRYRNEAQPLVVFEALAAGVPALSFARGCIAGDLGAAGRAVPVGEDFVQATLPTLRAWAADRAALHRAAEAALARARAAHEQSREGLERVVAMLIGPLPKPEPAEEGAPVTPRPL